MNQKDNLFDGKFTFLDAVKIALLIVTGVSTWNVVGIMTPDGPWAWVRQLAALIVVEGAFVGFEYATADAKSRRQVRWATIGFFCSLTVISLFAGLSGLLEFGGLTLMTQHAGDWLGLSWSVGDAVQASSLLTLVLWIAVLASIYRIYTLNDPDKRAQLDDIEIGEDVRKEANNAKRIAHRDVAPVVAGHRAIADVQSRYSDEMNPEQMRKLLEDVANRLQDNYSVRPDTAFVPAPVDPGRGFIPSPVDKTVAVDPEKGFVSRTPPMEKTVRHTSALGAYTADSVTRDSQRLIKELEELAKPAREPLPEIFRGEPIYFKSALETGAGAVKISKGDELQAILCEDGKYNLSEPNETYAFARVSADELDYWRTGVEVKPASSSFRSE